MARPWLRIIRIVLFSSCSSLIKRVWLFFLLLTYSTTGIHAFSSIDSIRVSFKEHSLGAVSFIQEDQKGFIWVAADANLYRFDGVEFVDINKLIQEVRFPETNIQGLHIDSDNQLWVFFYSSPLFRVDLNSYEITTYDGFQQNDFRNFYLRGYETDSGQLYLPHKLGLAKYNKSQDRFIIEKLSVSRIRQIAGIWKDNIIFNSENELYIYNLSDRSLESMPIAMSESGLITSMDIDDEGKLWVSIWYSDVNGLIRYDLESRSILQAYDKESSMASNISSTDVWSMYGDETAQYFATNSGGLFKFNFETQEMVSIVPKNEDKYPNGIVQLRAVYKDESNRLWAGGTASVFYQDRSTRNVRRIRFKKNESTLPSEIVRSSCSFADTKIAIGTEQGVSIFDLISGQYENLEFQVYNGNNYNNHINAIVAYEDAIWVGTWSSLIQIRIADYQISSELITYRNAGFDHPGGNADFRIGGIIQMEKSGDGGLWILNNSGDLRHVKYLSLGYKIDYYDFDFEKVKCNSIHYSEKFGFFVATDKGIYRFDNKGQVFYQWKFEDLSFDYNSDVQDIFVSDEGELALISDNKLYQTNLITFDDGWRQIHITDNIAKKSDPVVDHEGNIWLLGQSGISRINNASGSILRFDNEKHLWQASFNRRAGLRLGTLYSNGDIAYSSMKGLFVIGKNQEKIVSNPAFLMVDLLVNGKRLNNTPAHEVQELQLDHNENDLLFEFSVLNDPEPDLVTYRYKLENGNAGWQDLGSQRSLSISGLSPGDYNLLIHATSSDGIGLAKPVSVRMKIFSPWYLTNAAYALYLILFFLAFYFIYRIRLNTILKRKEAERIIELDDFKSAFFTNITHELRTPLTVVKGMAERIEKSPTRWSQRGALLIKRNSDRLLTLINEILSLSKLEQGVLTIDLIQADIIVFLRYVTHSFTTLAEINEMSLTFHSVESIVIMDFDKEKIQSILSNLISNAIKYSDSGAQIEVHISKDSHSDELLIKVSDTGIGIDDVHIEHLFNRYYRVKGGAKEVNVGAGIGLALVKELAQLMRGDVAVESEIGSGSVFSVRLPITNTAVMADAEIDFKLSDVQPNSDGGEGKKGEVLIVDDNEDIITYISACLYKDYRIVRASNGRQGIEVARHALPDLIISDVMMPIMGGFEMLENLKGDSLTDHIPIIMLTAKSSTSDRIMGLTHGADAYLSKPFEESELLAQINNLIEGRKKLQARYSAILAQDSIEKDNIEKVLPKFLVSLQSIVTTYIEDNTFGVEDLAREACISTRQLGRKLKALSGYTPRQFIRRIRLEAGRELLLADEMTIAQISLSVGFSSPQYFATVFKEEYGVAPSEYLQQ